MNKNNFSLSDIESFEYMTADEIDNLQAEIEKDTNNPKRLELLRAFITMKKQLAETDLFR
ncbi:hypothetical protein [Konateibacter massiliensis]|uniref:hypothetical protein n=1 Tax=Konateibacter massiliensis TaxID=2002841 RepID=UPI000C15FCE8|nr:hypothetical protein [Konateibacter massiliensis]